MHEPGFDAHGRGACPGAGDPASGAHQRLSGGQRAQVALTLVLAKRPELLLLDEPLANLDPLARREFLTSMFATCAEDGVAVLFSSHVIAELERICDYLIVLLAGRVRIAGDIDELRARHRVVSGPLGWPAAADQVISQHTRPAHRGAGALRRARGSARAWRNPRRPSTNWPWATSPAIRSSPRRPA